MYRIACVWILALTFPLPLRAAQESAQSDKKTADEEDAVVAQSEAPPEGELPNTSPPETDSGNPTGQVSDRLQKAEQEIAAQAKENEELRKQVAELSTRLDFVEMSDEAEYKLGDDVFERSLDIYGFLDTVLFYFNVAGNDAANGLFPDSLSFMVNRLNLYFSSRMTETLSAMVELRFTFLPHGVEKSYNLPMAGVVYERINSTVMDPLTGEEVTLGGLSIVRARMTWQPFEFLGFHVGRFITPYGIWNIEHGSPVIIPVRPPYLLVRNVIPRSQTGVQVFGAAFPHERFRLDYAVTVANGRGPTEAIYDLDNNKALGFRLKGRYEGKNWSLNLGGYLYWGETTDIVKTIDNLQPIHFSVEQKENYTEITGALDLLLEVFDFRLQAEYVRGSIKYDVRPLKVYPVIEIESPLSEYEPDYDKWCAYGLVAYTFRFLANQKEMTLTPFFVYEYNVFNETSKESTTSAYSGGLNFKPSPYVTLKYELSYIHFPESDYIDEGLWMNSGQVAFLF